MQRYPDWATRLSEYFRAAADKRFRYGQLDCCLFVTGAIEAMTGVDVAASFRGLYCSRREALDLVRARTGKPSIAAIAEQVSAEFGLGQIPVLQAQRGDAVLVARSRDYSLGIVSLHGDVAAAGRIGFLRLSRDRVVRAWKI